ncbi:hypothetical protein B0H16DRAFT_1896045 [Mycena metata]|uniref:TEA domain-containing protein n=1 Tax=Mycena metata TaxID=1033252 RepID=A0AAD7HLU0_9AGAR|nr:hypothetical protein B0H16DRAFT_1896045 [Mycena metata]
MDEDSWILALTNTQTLTHSVVDDRRLWRKSHRGEVVWPPHLETALIEGLQHYRPPVCRQTVLLRQYPGRNKFISHYIFSKTGEYRTTKQVGSRVQQLRELWPSPELRDLLFPTPSPRVESPWTTPKHQEPRRLTSQYSSRSHPRKEAQGFIPEFRQTLYRDEGVVSFSRPRRLVDIDPGVVLASAAAIIAESRFDVYTERGVVHTEVAEHQFLEDMRPGYFYRVDYSAVLGRHSEQSRSYSLHHPAPATKLDGAVVFSATYFRYRSESSTGGALRPYMKASV